jgi:alpha-methylacyl-CoA racemase
VSGPLEGLRILEIAGLGPGPFGALLLSDMGADVLRIDRVDRVGTVARRRARADLLARGRHSAAVDLKQPAGIELVLDLIAGADALIEGFRPGVMERLGLGPEACHARNPRLAYGRATGWGRSGPFAQLPGHDINYIALSGALEPVGAPGGPPVPPINMVGDLGGGMLLALGLLAAITHAARNGTGQVVDAAMIDASALLTMSLHSYIAQGRWTEPRGENMLDGGAPFYSVYACADDHYISVGAYEPKFYGALLEVLGVAPETMPPQMDVSQWPQTRERFARIFRERTCDAWCEEMAHLGVCFAPVLTPREAPQHPHHVERRTFIDVADVTQPAPAPRFSSTPLSEPLPPPMPGEHTVSALRAWGVPGSRIEELQASAVVA